jgi:UDPglucose 6-dehydrogenase
MMRLSVLGLGKLGAPLAACFASRNFEVIGVDLSSAKLHAIEKRQAPVYEPGLQDLLKSYGHRLKVTMQIPDSVCFSDASIVTVATPTDSSGEFSLDHVLDCCREIGRALAYKDTYHLVVITSTVMPGSMDRQIRPCLERASGKRAGADFGLCYSPEFVTLGNVIHDFHKPEFLLIGESDERAGKTLESIYQQVCDNDPPVAHMNFVSAELAKLAVNTFVTTKISFANLLARMCEKLEGADVEAVTSALGLDSRIGSKYLHGAISYGGPCFPRDNLALAALGQRLATPATIAVATDDFNRWQIRWLTDLVESYLPPGGVSGVLGLTYKPDTDVVEEAPGLLLAHELNRRGRPVIAFDPAGARNASAALGKAVYIASTAQECIDRSHVVTLATPWKEFSTIQPEWWVGRGYKRVVIDCWRFLKLGPQNGVQHVPLGIGSG